MRALTLLLAFIFCFSSAAFPQDFSEKKEQVIEIAPPQKSLEVGEQLTYSMEWLGIPVGKIILKNEGIVTIANRPCYHITARSFPNRFIRKLYDVEYNVHTYLDTELLYTRRFLKVRRIRKRFNYVLIDFDQEHHRAVYRSWGTQLKIKISPLRKKMKVIPTSEMPPGTQDLLSSFYYFRLLKIKEGESYPVNVYYNQANWPIYMQVEKPFMREFRKKGNFNVVSTFITSSLNDYILGRRKFFVYLTADSRRIPLEFKVGTALGSIRGIIQDFPE